MVGRIGARRGGVKAAPASSPGHCRRRLGGEEFCLLLPQTGLAVMEGAAQAGPEVDELLKRADDALYRAKANGKDRVVAYAPA
ncbi:MAG: hypothetical protein AB9900_03115 [Humidesulfovibrio sp.]